MEHFIHWKPTILFGSVVLGVVYGLVVIAHKIAPMSIFEIVVTLLCSAALFGVGASAFCRYFEVWLLIQQGEDPSDPEDHFHKPCPQPQDSSLPKNPLDRPQRELTMSIKNILHRSLPTHS